MEAWQDILEAVCFAQCYSVIVGIGTGMIVWSDFFTRLIS